VSNLFDLDKAHQRLRDSRSHLEPDAPNFVRVRYTGGTENRLGETEGATRQEKKFTAVVYATNARSDFTGGRLDADADLEFEVDEDMLQNGDRVERLSDGTPFRVLAVTDLGGGDHEVGWKVSLEEQED